MKHKEPSLFSLVLFASFASVTAVLYTPALPEMTKILGITSGQAQLTLTTFLIGYALGALPYGPLSNRFGRKPALFVGLTIAMIGALLNIVAGKLHLFGLLVFARFISALGCAVGLKITYTIIGDIYSQEEARKKISWIILAAATTPGLGIVIGGFLTKHLGWASCFDFLALYSAFLFVLALFLPETSKSLDSDALNFRTIISGFAKKFSNRSLVVCALLNGLGSSFIYLFAAEAPFIGIDRIGLSPEHYGLLNFIPPLGLVVGSLWAIQLVGKKEALSIILLGIVIILFWSLMMLFLFVFKIVKTWSLFFPPPLIYMGISLVVSNAAAIAMSHAQNKSNASAVMNFINVSTCVIFVWLLGLSPKKLYILPLFFVFLGCLMFLFRSFFLKPCLQEK